MPIDPKEIPALFERFQPQMEGLNGTYEDFEYFYNTMEQVVRAGTPLESVTLPPQFHPLAKALYAFIKQRLDAPPPRPPVAPPVDEPVTSLKEALALLTAGAREKLKALLSKNPNLQEKLKEIGEHLQSTGVKLASKQPSADSVGNLTPSTGVAEGKQSEVIR